MNYPIPQPQGRFAYGQKQKVEECTSTHYTQVNPYMAERNQNIQKHHKYLLALPFVQSIYLVNSMTFNALHAESDIDLCIITQPWCIRRARLFSRLICTLLGIKRRSSPRQKYCLSFYIDADHQNLYPIKLPDHDPYLTYRIAHSHPLVHHTHNTDSLLAHNHHRLQTFLPNIPRDTIPAAYLPKTICSTQPWITRVIQKLLAWKPWDITEKIIKTIWVPVLFFKKKRLQNCGKNIIISDHTLKFYKDIRPTIRDLFKTDNQKLP